MDSSSSRRRRPLSDLLGVGDDDDLEEGEYVPAHYQSSSSSSDDDVHHPQHGGRTRRLEDIIGAGAPLPVSPTPSSESGGTISDHRSGGSSGAGGGHGVRPARKFPCHVCGKGFSSRKAVDGHMRVHGSGSGVLARHAVPPAPAPVGFSAGWAATGRRGCTGGKGGKPPAAAAASLNSESTTGHSTAIVAVQVQQPLDQPVPMATNLSPMPSSTRTNLSSGEDDEGSSASATALPPVHHDEPVVAAAAAVVKTAANPSATGARAAAPVDRQLAAADHRQQAPTPQPQVHCQAVPAPPPAAQKAQSSQLPLVPPPAPPAAAVQLQQGGGQQLVVPRPAHQPPQEYSCKVCGKTYPTHQGLGGHAAGHKNRQREQEAMAAAAGMMMMMMPGGGVAGGEFLAALRRGRKPEEPHACQKCNKVFATGVALGGHMRMHYTGPPIVHKSKRRCVALAAGAPPPPPPPAAVSEADLRLALSAAAKAVEEPSAAAAAAPAVAGGTGILRLFGIDIGPLGQQAPSSEQQGSDTGTTEGSSSAAGEKQDK